MRGYVAPTDYDWYSYLRAIQPPVDEVNFWKPGEANFRALEPGEPFFFKLKSPYDAIAGFGYFAHFSQLPVSMVWPWYGEANGAASYREMRERLFRYRSRFDRSADPKQDFRIGCILINQPVFFDDDEWVRVPADYRPQAVQGCSYDLTDGEGRRMWLECLERAASHESWRTPHVRDGVSLTSRIAQTPIVSGYGSPGLVRPRLGQRSFRVAVLDTYGRRCAITNEKTLPVLEAAHICDYSALPVHVITNGILFRADVHKLFDAGYVTVTPEYRFEVSRRIKEEFENGRDYYALHGSAIRLPVDPASCPARESLVWHNEQRYLG